MIEYFDGATGDAPEGLGPDPHEPRDREADRRGEGDDT